MLEFERNCKNQACNNKHAIFVHCRKNTFELYPEYLFKEKNGLRWKRSGDLIIILLSTIFFSFCPFFLLLKIVPFWANVTVRFHAFYVACFIYMTSHFINLQIWMNDSCVGCVRECWCWCLDIIGIIDWLEMVQQLTSFYSLEGARLHTLPHAPP